MLIGKNVENVLNSVLYVDKWEVEHRDNCVTGDTDLVETYAGQVKMGKSVEQKYRVLFSPALGIIWPIYGC